MHGPDAICQRKQSGKRLRVERRDAFTPGEIPWMAPWRIIAMSTAETVRRTTASMTVIPILPQWESIQAERAAMVYWIWPAMSMNGWPIGLDLTAGLTSRTRPALTRDRKGSSVGAHGTTIQPTFEPRSARISMQRAGWISSASAVRADLPDRCGSAQDDRLFFVRTQHSPTCHAEAHPSTGL